MIVKNFSEWLDINHLKYEKLGVNKKTAKQIWNAACDILAEEILRRII